MSSQTKIDITLCLNVVNSYGLNKVSTSGNEITACCPFHKNGQEKNPSWGMRSDGVYYCFTCGEKGNLLTFIQKLDSCSLEEAEKKLFKFVDPSEQIKDFRQELYNAMTPKKKERKPLVELKGDIKPELIVEHPWSLERVDGDFETIKKFKVGYFKKTNQIIIPHYYLGKLRGVMRRNLDWPDAERKYQNSYRFPTSITLFNFDEAIKYPAVYVVESAIDVIRADSWGYNNFVSNFGTSVSSEKANLLIGNWKSVILALDNDEAGNKAMKEYVKYLKNKVDLNVLLFPEGKKDLGDISKEEFENLTPINYIKNKIFVTE